jgi:DNA-binding IclR family transcriptional regulator
VLRKAMDVLSLFDSTRREIGVLEAVGRLGWPKSTTSRILSAMARAGFIDRDESSRRYRVGMRLAALGVFAQQSTTLQRLVRPALEWLTAQTGETASLAVLTGSEGVDVEVVESSHSIKPSDFVGRRFPLHATASGKVLLAWLSSDELRELLELPLKRYTPATITSLKALLTDLEHVRHDGYSTAVGEFEEDLFAIASPVRNHTGVVVGAVAIGAPISRSSRKPTPRLAKSVMEAAGRASAALAYRERTG